MSLSRVLCIWQIQSEIHFLYRMLSYIRDFVFLLHWKILNNGISYRFNFNFDGKCEIDFIVAVSIPLSQNRWTATMLKIYVSWTSHTFTKPGKTFINHITSHHIHIYENEKERDIERVRERERERIKKMCPRKMFENPILNISNAKIDFYDFLISQ